MRDAIVVVTTATTYTLLHVGRINNLAEVPPVPALADLPDFLQPPHAQPGHEFIQEPELLSNYILLPELRRRSLDFPPVEPIVPEIPVPVIEISSSNSHNLVVEPRQASSSSKSNPSEETSTAASRVSRRSPGRACDSISLSSPLWICTPIIP